MSFVELPWREATDVRQGISKRIATLVALLVAASTVSLLFRDSIRDEFMCRLRLHTTITYESVSINIPARRHPQLLLFLKEYSRSRNLLFAVDVYPPGTLGFSHQSYEIGICNRVFLATLGNPFSSDEFTLYTGSFGSPSARFRELHRSLVQGLGRISEGSSEGSSTSTTPDSENRKAER